MHCAVCVCVEVMITTISLLQVDRPQHAMHPAVGSKCALGLCRVLRQHDIMLRPGKTIYWLQLDIEKGYVQVLAGLHQSMLL